MSKLFIICGLSFAGKSTLAKAIVARFGYVEVDVDRTKVTLYGLEIDDADLTHEAWNTVYADTDRQIVNALNAAKNVVDASRNFRKAERDHIRGMVSALGHQVVTIYLNVPESVVRQRWLVNRNEPTRSDVTDQDFEEIVRLMEPPQANEQALTYHDGDDIDHWISHHVSRLR